VHWHRNSLSPKFRFTSSASDGNVGPYDKQRPVARQQPPAYDRCCGGATFRPRLSSPDLPDRVGTLATVMLDVLMVKASRPGRDAGKGVCWDTRDANEN
jgi:hypothetical protein